MTDQEEIYKRVLSKYSEESIKLIEDHCKECISQALAKEPELSDFMEMINDETIDVTSIIASVLDTTSQFHDPQKQVWRYMIEQVSKLGATQDEHSRSLLFAIFGYSYSQFPNKQLAWNSIIELTSDQNKYVRKTAIYALGSAFPYMPDKQQAWSDLIKLINDPNKDVRWVAYYILYITYLQVPDQQQARNNLIKLASNQNNEIRLMAVALLDKIYPQVPDQQQAWNELIKLANDQRKDVRRMAVTILDNAYPQVPDKQQAWNDLIKLANDQNNDVRRMAVSFLNNIYPQVPDKQQAWNDLIKLANDQNKIIRQMAIVLEYAYSLVPDKHKAWNDLIKLANNQKIDVKHIGASVINSVFSQMPDKQQVWNDLIKLINDKDSYVKSHANHSLGKISIYNASQAENEDDYKKELEKAIEFFEKAAEESSYGYNNPSQFCLPFYLSYYIIIFKKEEMEKVVNKYLIEAKKAVEGSKSKKLLLGAVNNLANALKEVQSLENMDLLTMQEELNFYRRYCDRAAEFINKAEETAPFAIKVMKKGLPILDRNLKELIEEIQEKARIACKESKGTEAEEIVCEINEEIQCAIHNYEEPYIEILEDLVSILKIKIPSIPENMFILSKIELLESKTISAEKYRDLPLIISMMPTMKVVSEQDLDRKLGKLDLIYDKTIRIEAKLDLIQKELDKGLDKLETLSMEVEGRDGELIKAFSKEILELKERGDKETLKSFLNEVLIKQDILIKEIEKSPAPPMEKEESKRSILNVRSVIDKVKHPIKSFGKDVTKEIVVTYAAEEIIKLVFQLVSMTAFGVTIPPHICNLLSSLTKELKK